MNKRNVLLVLGVAIIALSLLGVSYAFYLANITAEDTNPITITSGDLELVLDATNAINLVENVKPGSSQEKDFTVTNNGLATYYNIKLVEVETDFVGEDLKYTVTSKDGTVTEEGYINISNVGGTLVKGDGQTTKDKVTDGKVTLVTKKKIAVSPTVDTYTFKLEFVNKPEDDQNNNQGAYFKGKINIDQDGITDTAPDNDH